MKPYYSSDLGKLYLGDCLEVMKQFPDKYFDLTITSPPYDNLRSYDTGIGGSWNFEIFKLIAKELFRVIKIGGVVVWVVGDQTINGSETGTSFKQALYFKECGFNLHDTMIYQKINYVPLNHNRYEQAFEFMFILSKSAPKVFNPIKIICKNAGLKHNRNHTDYSERFYSMRNRQQITLTKETKTSPNIFSYIIGNNGVTHPASFPEKLAADHIVSWSNENDLIFDPFMGSGTVAQQAEILKRRWLGCEISKQYCEISAKRIDAAASQMSF